MLKAKEKYNLKQYNTFGIKAYCKKYVSIQTVANLYNVLKNNTLPLYLLGGGSNILLTQDYYETLFLKINIKGKKIAQNTEGGKNDVIVEIGAGENWHNTVLWALKKDLSGIENLSLIPGTVGAAPIQNIGAYGVELKDVFVKLEAINLQTFDIQTFTKEDCQFGYRDSVFKKELKGKYCITKVYLKLTANNHKLNTNYGDIQKVLSDMKIEKPTIQDVSNAIIYIRQSKLPDPSVLGNAGSFFKNPEVNTYFFEKLKANYPNIVGFPTQNGVKLAAAWLIDQCGWKGKRFGNIGIHEKQALVLVNYGHGKGLEIKQLAERIQASVLEKYGVALEMEVNIV